MQKKEQRFRVVKFRFETDAEEIWVRYMITDNYIPFFRANQWIELKSIRKASTGLEYAKKLAKFLNWLDQHGMSYDQALNRHVRDFLHYLIFGGLENERYLSIHSTIGSSTLEQYITVITGFYRWLDEVEQTEMVWKERHARANKSFLYGQIYSYEYRGLVDGYATMLKSGRDYIKWYDEETKRLLCKNFQTLRDEAVLRLTFEGLRIDEVLSVTLDSYNATERLIQPTRSKGRTSATVGRNILRTIALPSKTCEVLDRYIQTERATAEMESGKISQYIFINLNAGAAQGEPLGYRNYLKILKRCARRAGIDERKIRTHNGRSTKVMEFLEHQALHPEDNITDGIIMEVFGWKNFSSIDHYRDHNNQIIAKSVMEKLHKGGDENE